MCKPTRYLIMAALIFNLSLFQATPVMALNEDELREAVEARLAASEKLQDMRVDVYVEGRLVVLVGDVRFYEQKLVSERIAWTTPGVFEVDNEIVVSPRLPLSDTAIERKIRSIINAHERFRAATVIAKVDNGRVRLQGSFLVYSDPTDLKHRVAEIEGVVDIEISATFLARP